MGYVKNATTAHGAHELLHYLIKRQVERAEGGETVRRKRSTAQPLH